MMERRESHLTHRQRSNKASLAWLLVCTVGAALLAAMIAAQGPGSIFSALRVDQNRTIRSDRLL
jgi:hypothetical protein